MVHGHFGMNMNEIIICSVFFYEYINSGGYTILNFKVRLGSLSVDHTAH